MIAVVVVELTTDFSEYNNKSTKYIKTPLRKSRADFSLGDDKLSYYILSILLLTNFTILLYFCITYLLLLLFFLFL